MLPSIFSISSILKLITCTGISFFYRPTQPLYLYDFPRQSDKIMLNSLSSTRKIFIAAFNFLISIAMIHIEKYNQSNNI